MSESKDTTIALNVRLKPPSPQHTRARRTTPMSQWHRALPIWISASLSRLCLLRLRRQPRTAKRQRRGWMGILSPAWQWTTAPWHACSSRFGKCWSACDQRSLGSRRDRFKRKEREDAWSSARSVVDYPESTATRGHLPAGTCWGPPLFREHGLREERLRDHQYGHQRQWVLVRRHPFRFAERTFGIEQSNICCRGHVLSRCEQTARTEAGRFNAA